jgi:hypothetical protein
MSHVNLAALGTHPVVTSPALAQFALSGHDDHGGHPLHGRGKPVSLRIEMGDLVRVSEGGPSALRTAQH